MKFRQRRGPTLGGRHMATRLCRFEFRAENRLDLMARQRPFWHGESQYVPERSAPCKPFRAAGAIVERTKVRVLSIRTHLYFIGPFAASSSLLTDGDQDIRVYRVVAIIVAVAGAAFFLGSTLADLEKGNGRERRWPRRKL